LRATLPGDAERDEDEEELLDDEDLDEADFERRFGGSVIPSCEVSWPAIAINFACRPETVFFFSSPAATAGISFLESTLSRRGRSLSRRSLSRWGE